MKTSTRTIAYLRVSTDKQTNLSQELEIRKWSDAEAWRVDEWIEVSTSSGQTLEKRRIPELLDKLQPGDTLVTYALDRLGRSAGQVCTLIDELVKRKINFVSLRDGIRLNGRKDMTATIMVSTFSLLAELERAIIRERTIAGLQKARAEGRIGGRPKGSLGPSKLDPHKEEIARKLSDGVPKTRICRDYQTSGANLDQWIRSRKLNVKKSK